MGWEEKLYKIASEVNLIIGMATIGPRKQIISTSDIQQTAPQKVNMLLFTVMWLRSGSHESITEAMQYLLQALGKCTAHEYLEICITMKGQLQTAIMSERSSHFQHEIVRLSRILQATLHLSSKSVEMRTAINRSCVDQISLDNINASLLFIGDLIHMILLVVQDICQELNANVCRSRTSIIERAQELLGVCQQGFAGILMLSKKLNRVETLSMKLALHSTSDLLANQLSTGSQYQPTMHYQTKRWLLSLVADAMISCSRISPIACTLQTMGEFTETEDPFEILHN